MPTGQHIFGIATNSSGAPTSGASINVHPSGALTALTIYSDVNLTTTKTNPFTVNNDGTWEFYAAKGQTIRIRVTQSGAVTRDIDNIYLPGEVDTASLTNQTGVTLAVGDVVGLGTGSASSVIIDDTQSSLRKFVVSLQAPAQGASGLFASGGVVASVKATGTINLGRYIRKSATSRSVEDAGISLSATNEPPQGAIGISLNTASGGTVDAWLFKDPVFIPTNSGGWSSVGQVSLNNSGTPNTQFDLDADIIILRNSTNSTVVRFNPGAAITCNISTAGPAANGRDQAGALSANSWIHFYWIWNGSTLATTASATAPPTGPTLPTGYTHWAYAGAVRLDGSSNLVRTRIMGDIAYYEAFQTILATGSAASETTVGLATWSPPNALAIYLMAYFRTTVAGVASGADSALVRYISGSNYKLMAFDNATNARGGDTDSFWIPNVSQQVFYLIGSSPGSTSPVLDLYGLAYRLPNAGA